MWNKIKSVGRAAIDFVNKGKSVAILGGVALLGASNAHAADGIDFTPITDAFSTLGGKLVAAGALVVAAAMAPLAIKFGVRWLKGLWKASAS